MYNRIFCVPTHREILDEFLTSFFEEVTFANEEMDLECPLVFFDDTGKNTNKNKIENLKKQYSSFDIHHITGKDVVDIYNTVYEHLNEKHKDTFKKLYPNNNANYGNVFNRIFLFATLFGAETIHRRDSDVLSDKDVNGKYVFPIEIEAANLAHKHNGRTTYVVGGGYKGKYNLDIDDLVDNGDYTLVKELFDCMSIPKEHHDAIVQDEILCNNLPFTGDKIEHNSGSYPDCGNVGLYKLHEYLPIPTQDFVLGSDYFFIDVAVHAKLDLVYHNRSVIHKHTPDRVENPNKIFNYWKGLMMLVDSQIFYRNFYEKYLDSQDFGKAKNLEEIVPVITSGMKDFYPDFIKDFDDERRDKSSKLVTLLSKSKNNTVQMISNNLLNIKEDIFKETNSSIKGHIELLETWGPIIETAKAISESKQIQNTLNDTIIRSSVHSR